MTIDNRIDDYIKKAQPFAQPILIHIRKLVHDTCPEVLETIKWGMPHFDYCGSTILSMASFKAHCAFGFYKASLMKDALLIDTAKSEEAMGHFGKITSIKNLPSDKKLIAYIKEAMVLNEKGIQLTKPKKIISELPTMPDVFAKTLKANKQAATKFEAMSNSCKKEYISWIADAKTEATQLKRLSTAMEWIADGKDRHWKYK